VDEKRQQQSLQKDRGVDMEKQIGRFVNSKAEVKFLEMYDEAMNRWPDSRGELKLETSFGRTHVHSYGNGKGDPIVLLHGANGTSASWANNIVALGEHHPVFAVDTIGDAGRSIQKAPIQHAEDYAAWLDEVLQGLGLKEVHLIGASYGGWIILNQAVHSPRLLQSITLLDPARALAGLTYAAWPFMLWASMIGPDFIRRAFIRWTDAGSLTDENQIQLVVSAMRDYKMQRIPPQYVKDDELRSVKVPVLLLLGGKSPMHNSNRAAIRAKKLLQDVEVEILPQAGHKLPADLVNDRILRFIKFLSSNTS
jgi:pimeloyl-ACP methyl ester carboxylesterase